MGSIIFLNGRNSITSWQYFAWQKYGFKRYTIDEMSLQILYNYNWFN